MAARSPEAVALRVSNTTPMPATVTKVAAKRVESGPVQGLKVRPQKPVSSVAAPWLR